MKNSYKSNDESFEKCVVLTRNALKVFNVKKSYKSNDESFDKCVSFELSLARKALKDFNVKGSYNQMMNHLKNACLVFSARWQEYLFRIKSEKAKELLWLIHSDVCSRFRHESRKDASYFIIFMNDFSRYGYVYLLKHKHEVIWNIQRV